MANEQIRSVQEELRKRNLYFGEVDGRRTEETVRAIQRYQQRQGFAAGGELDNGTLRSLGLTEVSAAPGEEWPEGAVLKGDSPRAISEADRKLLENWNAAEPPPIGSQPPAPPEAPAPEPAEPPVASAPVPQQPAPEAAPTATEPRVAPKTAGPTRVTPSAPKAARPPAIAERGNREASRRGDDFDADGFVRRYLEACASNRLEAELQFYAPKLDYFDHGTVDQSFVRRDVQRFYAHWPERHYELLDLDETPLPNGDREVSFRLAFRYANDKQKVSGRTMNKFRIRADEQGARFVALKEQRLRR